MDDEAAAKIKKPANTVILHVTPLQLIIALIAFLLVFLIIRSAFRVANEAEAEISSSGWGYHVGLVTILFGVFFVALGLPILVNSFLKMSEQLLKPDEKVYAGCEDMNSVRIIIVRFIVTLITLIMLAWASYTGYRLATEPKRDDKYYPLIFPIGVVTMAFGTVYIIIGLALIADLALAMTTQFFPREKKGITAQDRNTEEKSFV